MGKKTREFRVPAGKRRIFGAGTLPKRGAVFGGKVEEPRDQEFVGASVGHGGTRLRMRMVLIEMRR